MSDKNLFPRATVSIMKATAICGVSRRTIYNWLGWGRVDFTRTPGGSVRIYADSLFRSADSKPVPISHRVDGKFAKRPLGRPEQPALPPTRPGEMRLSTLIQTLQGLMAREGDLLVVVQTLSHVWPPEPVVRERASGSVVLLNP